MDKELDRAIENYTNTAIGLLTLRDQDVYTQTEFIDLLTEQKVKLASFIEARDAAKERGTRIDELENVRIAGGTHTPGYVHKRLQELRTCDLVRPTPEGVFRPSREEDFDE